MEFQAFPKIPRYHGQPVVITEKIDGTNAQVAIDEEGNVYAGSRTRWVTPDNDNYGFAAWVEEHKQELLALGPGRHYGEWWGSKINREYGLMGERRFSLFNVARWADNPNRPQCCLVVPILYRGETSEDEINAQLFGLYLNGSRAEPGFERPEGIVIHYPRSGITFKRTLDGEKPKGAR